MSSKSSQSKKTVSKERQFVFMFKYITWKFVQELFVELMMEITIRDSNYACIITYQGREMVFKVENFQGK